MIARPYEPPPDYPMLEERWPNNHSQPSSHRSHSIDAVFSRSSSAFFHHPQNRQKYDYPICGVSPAQPSPYRHSSQSSRNPDQMLRTRQFPEIAGIYGNDEQPALRRFTRYNQSINVRNNIHVDPPPPLMPTQQQQQPPKGSLFSKNTKKPLFFMGNWTFRERNKSSRPPISESMREDRPHSMHFTETTTRHHGARSKSGEVASSSSNRTSISIGDRHVETRIPVRIERSSMVRSKPSNSVTSNDSSIHSPSSSSSSSSSASPDFKTNITVDDTQIAVLRPKKEPEANNNNNNNRFSFQSCVQLRKSCPDLDTSSMSNMEQHRVSKKRTRRAKEKVSNAAWKRKHVKDWTLDDVLLWLQSSQMDQVASLLIGYDLRGEDLLQWNDQTLAQLGVGNEQTRTKLLDELKRIIENGPQIEDSKSNNHKTLFDIVKQTSYDQVLAVETPLTTRDITVTHGRLGCLQITKVNGANLPLNEHDCLLEINERAGEQFKSALMLTKLISDSNGAPIRFVVLRRKTDTNFGESMKDTSSSGISSSPQTPTE